MSRRLVLDDGRSQRELVLREKMTVGRDPACDISDSDPRLSRRHAEFLATTHGLLVRDLQSRNGIRVNGRAVREASLNPGDLIEIAHLTVRFLDDSTDAVGVPSSASSEAGDAAEVREGFEDDRTRVLPAPKLPFDALGVFRFIDVVADVRGRDFGSVMKDVNSRLTEVAFPL